TDQIEEQAAAYIARIDKMGGALRAVEEGFIQREIQDAAYRTQRDIESGDQIVVGVNRYQTDE
ncbi:MAG: methylmalonyl-CoA mutase, partial [Caldilineaceae bacterium]|nr:methylmalonyl-CoA mutase [Caldilineaceae bacterium]